MIAGDPVRGKSFVRTTEDAGYKWHGADDDTALKTGGPDFRHLYGTDISSDDGRNWRPLRPGPTDPPDADQHWNALSLPFVVGPHGRIGKLRSDAIPSRP